MAFSIGGLIQGGLKSFVINATHKPYLRNLYLLRRKNRLNVSFGLCQLVDLVLSRDLLDGEGRAFSKGGISRIYGLLYV